MWKDVSSYSQSDKERKPNTFACTVGGFRLGVWWNSRFEPFCWVGYMHGIFDNDYFNELSYDKLPQAKAAVVKKAEIIAKSILTDLKKEKKKQS